jgi:hypothetical protein
VTRDDADAAAFGAPVPADELVGLLAQCGFQAVPEGAGVRCAGDLPEVVAVLAFAHGWAVDPATDGTDLRLRPVSP